MERTDERLLRRAARGDPNAVARLYEDHVDALYAFVFYRVDRDESMAEDVVQETFVSALDRMDRFDQTRGSLGSWLRSLSRNVVRSHLRAQKRLATLERWDRVDAALVEALSELDTQPLSDEIIERAQTRDLVNMTIANLPERYRAALERKYVEGATVEELATALGVSEDAAKSLLSRARRAFRETFLTMTREWEVAIR